jgi:hypothetical protein
VPIRLGDYVGIGPETPRQLSSTFDTVHDQSILHTLGSTHVGDHPGRVVRDELVPVTVELPGVEGSNVWLTLRGGGGWIEIALDPRSGRLTGFTVMSPPVRGARDVADVMSNALRLTAEEGIPQLDLSPCGIDISEIGGPMDVTQVDRQADLCRVEVDAGVIYILDPSREPSKRLTAGSLDSFISDDSTLVALWIPN